MREVQIYEVELEDDDIGIQAVSFVHDPAISKNLVYFAKCKDNHSTMYLNNEKREVVSPILIPNQLILRYDDNGNPYYIKWTEKTIRKIAERFIQNQFLNCVTIEHPQLQNPELTYDEVLEKGVYMLKCWIVENPKTDVANTKYNFFLPKGSLVCHYKVHNNKLWKMIKSGEVRGLSIEALATLYVSENKIKLSKIKKMKKSNNMSLLQRMVQFLNEVTEEVKGLEAVANNDETESGVASLKYYTSDGDIIEVDAEGTCIATDGSVVEDGEYALTDGNVLVVKDGKFSGTIEKGDAEEEVEEAPIAEAKEEEDEEKKKEEEVPTEEEPTEEVPTEEETPIEELPTEEVELPYTLVPFEIDGIEYQIPQEVYDYIQSITKTSETFRKEIATLQSRVPSAKVNQGKINQGVAEASEDDRIANIVRLLNKR